MKKYCKYYKTANISYMSKGNEELKQELKSLVVSSEKPEVE
jgi:hypothetical protein